ncbi:MULTISPECIES: GGDEF domain-containing protein [Shinella]|jgi:diguanylate cyclase (GGDEF)-like protein|uniref:diguanylate cyclase n=1 Tax=Shinella granuli TaxID=323621 RepID=A0A4R2CQA9_SHIGR|nr:MULTISPECIES: GGDEF domain-containing protein [Shinella]ANH03951.1 diguanylate cyclase [Shinella sp. HZN7]TCN41459.1 diguanylate cyclase (GGDEF)-like protein [Shinella granuli]
MGTENLILLLIEAGFYFVFMVGLLHLRHQLGIGMFIAALGVMHFLETYLAAVFYIELPFGVISPGSSVLFSGKLMMILLLYVKEDASVVRAPIYGLLAGNFLTVGLGFFLRHHQTIGVVPGRIADLAFIDEMGWLMLWGTTLLYLDSLAIILLYERLGRVFKKSTALRFFVSGVAVLTFDQIGFFAALHFLNGAPTEVFWGGWIAKMLAASAYAVLITVYLHYSRISAIPVSPRPISDIFADLTFRERYEDLLDRSGRDALTGVYDRSRLEYEAPRMLSAMMAAGKPLALMIIDADHFKDVNDRFGHLAGDGVLKETAASLQRALRASDRLFRFGGEEFVVICEDIAPAAGTERAEMLRRTVEAEIRRPDGVPMTVSIGVANSYSDGTTLNALLSAADARLYAAKNAGRNRVISS